MGLKVVGRLISDNHTYTKYVLKIPFLGEFKFRITSKNKLKVIL